MTNPDQKKTSISTLFAFLFHYGESIKIKHLANFLEATEEETQNLITSLQEDLARAKDGALMLITENQEVRLVTKPELAWVNQKIRKEELEETLTPVAEETLALIAYLGPIGRPMLDFIRGVNTSFTLRSLVMRGLVEKQSGKKGAVLYQATAECLNHLGVSRFEDLPEYSKYRNILEKFELKENA